MIEILKTNKNISDFLNKISNRGGDSFSNPEIEKTVIDIITDVRERGDHAVREYTAKFDCPDALYYRVPGDVIDKAAEEADNDFIGAMKRCIFNITAYHEEQKREGYTLKQADGVVLKQRVCALDSVGLYVPGGTAAYPSTVLMNAIPAKIAGVREIVIVTPPRKDGTPNPDILTAAKLCGVDKVFMCGGAQAVAALAFGTEEIPKVSKVVGPGNIYVTTAKRLMYGTFIDIDMTAGPSEILIIADETANPRYIAADLLSQAEHDKLASAVLITTSDDVAGKTAAELEKQLSVLPRKEIAEESLKNYGAVIIVKDMEEAVRIANTIAPEHLEVLTENPFELEDKLINVGSLFLGEYSPEPLGDYFAGTNHVLPTNGTARFFSPLSVDSFVKKSSSIYYTKKAFDAAANDITLIAGREGLDAHARSVKTRTEE